MSTPSKVASASTTTPDNPPPAVSTPTKRAAFAPSAEAGPSRRPAGAGASPAYSSRRHSLYGVEDRVVIDPGSRVWKVGPSGEVEPRACLSAVDEEDRYGTEAWTLDLDSLRGCHGDRKEARRLIRARVTKKMREVYHKHLLTDSKTRKVIVLENTYLPAAVKEAIAEALFDNLKVLSVAFTPASLLALVACGKITGLVVDVGWLETTVTPVSYSRPLLHLARSTPLAGRALHERVRLLIRHQATYHPPPPDQAAPAAPQGRPLPTLIITEAVVSQVNVQTCFVLADVCNRRSTTLFGLTGAGEELASDIASMRAEFAPNSTAADCPLRIPHWPAPKIGASYGTLVVPGWVRERVAEMFFDVGHSPNADIETIPDAVMECLSKLPIDLRQTMVGNILVTGGTALLPGFIPRLRSEIYERLRSAAAASAPLPITPPIGSPAHTALATSRWRRRSERPYACLAGLAPHLAILNDPCPLSGPGSGKGGGAPRWRPSLIGWIGGSLAGAMKVSGPEVTREEYDARVRTAEVAGEDWKMRVDEALVEAQTQAGAEPEPEADVPPRTGTGTGAGQGLELEALRPGEAVGVWPGKRKRGWNAGRVLDDWTTGTPVKA